MALNASTKSGSRSSAALKASTARGVSLSSSRRLSPSANHTRLARCASAWSSGWPSMRLEDLGRLPRLARLAVQHVQRVHHLERLWPDAQRLGVGVDGGVRVLQPVAGELPELQRGLGPGLAVEHADQRLPVLGRAVPAPCPVGQLDEGPEAGLVAGVDGQRLLEVVLRPVVLLERDVHLADLPVELHDLEVGQVLAVVDEDGLEDLERLVLPAGLDQEVPVALERREVGGVELVGLLVGGERPVAPAELLLHVAHPVDLAAELLAQRVVLLGGERDPCCRGSPRPASSRPPPSAPGRCRGRRAGSAASASSGSSLIASSYQCIAVSGSSRRSLW